MSSPSRPEAARDLILKALKSQEMQQKHLAAKAHIKTPTLNMFLKGQRRPTTPLLYACAGVLKLDVGMLQKAQDDFDHWASSAEGRRKLQFEQRQGSHSQAGILVDWQIAHHIESGDLQVSPFDRENLQPASFDLTRGTFKRLISGYPLYPEDAQCVIKEGETVIVYSREKIRMPDFLVARAGGVSFLLQHGLCTTFGLHLDPRFDDHPFALIRNVGFEPYDLEPGEPFLSVEFSYTATTPSFQEA